jgi:hypothetical protein
LPRPFCNVCKRFVPLPEDKSSPELPSTVEPALATIRSLYFPQHYCTRDWIFIYKTALILIDRHPYQEVEREAVFNGKI